MKTEPVIPDFETLSKNKVERKLDVGKMGSPVFKMVLTAVGDYAYFRPQDGVIVCPLAALKE